MKRQNGDADRLKNLVHRKNVRLAKRLDKGRSLKCFAPASQLNLKLRIFLSVGRASAFKWRLVRDTLCSLTIGLPKTLRWYHGRASGSIFRSIGRSLGFQGYCLQKPLFEGLRRLRRCRSLEHVLSGSWRRDACGRNSRRQSRFAQGLWNRSLLSRGTRLTAAHRSASDAKERRSTRRMATALPTASPDCGTSSAS